MKKNAPNLIKSSIYERRTYNFFFLLNLNYIFNQNVVFLVSASDYKLLWGNLTYFCGENALIWKIPAKMK